MFTPRPEVENSAIISVRIREERERDRERLTRTAWLSPFLADFGPISSSESTTTRLLGGICFGILGSFSSFCFFLFEFDGGWLREEWKTLIARLNRSHNVELIIKIFLVNRISLFLYRAQKTYRLSYSVYKNDAIAIADPSSMQDGCHMK